MPGESHPCAVVPQQLGRPVEWAPGRHADIGVAAQKTATNNISNAPFLSQVMM